MSQSKESAISASGPLGDLPKGVNAALRQELLFPNFAQSILAPTTPLFQAFADLIQPRMRTAVVELRPWSSCCAD
jgi:hypothetical protein